jgi:D-3-phosphoglycerate dehydrogenase
MSKTSLDKSKIKFLLLEGVHPSAVDVLKAAGYTSIEYITSSLPEAQLKERSPTRTLSAFAHALS